MNFYKLHWKKLNAVET